MIDTLSGFRIESNNSVFHRIVHSVGYVAQMGVGLTKVAFDGLHELRDPEIGILRSHRIQQQTVDQQVNIGPLIGLS
jgi:hypothetical protein